MSVTVQIGQIWHDRDKRMWNGNRHCKVIAINGAKAEMVQCRADGASLSDRIVRVSLRRLARQIGWKLT